MNLTNVALPNLIAPDLVIVQPMSSFSGYITYLNYTYGTNNKAEGVEQGDIMNGVFALGNAHSEYTSERVVESFAYADATDHKTFVLAWKGLLDGTALKGGTVTVAGEDAAYTASEADGKTTIVLTTALEDGESVRVGYVYDNVVIPQNDIPTLNVEMKSIGLVAHARRIAVYYSQIAAFQA